MNLFRKPAAVAVTALALAVLPSVAEAHDGGGQFKNCTEAYESGHSNIPKGDPHYGTHLDRDGDGIGCDQPPADFVAAEDEAEAADSGEDTPSGAPDQQGTDLAETGGSSATPYLAGGGAAVLLAGGGVLLAARRRRTDS